MMKDASDKRGISMNCPEDLADLDALNALDTGTDFSRGESDLFKRIRLTASEIRRKHEPAEVLKKLLETAGIDEESRPGYRLIKTYSRLRAIFLVTGILTGATLATGLLIYDGSRPVNVLTYLAVAMIPQLLLLLLLIIGIIAGHNLERLIPVAGGLRNSVSRIRFRLAGHWFPSSGKKLPEQYELSDTGSLYAGIDQWRSISLMQWIAIGFNIGLAGAMIFRLAFTDIVFGWSTTFGFVADIFPRMVEWISLPWSFWLSSGTVDSATVEATRYMRSGAGQIEWAGGALHPDILLFSGWRPFLFSVVLFYGLIPRVIMLGICNIMAHLHLRKAVKENSRIDRFRKRMLSPLVEIETCPANPDNSNDISSESQLAVEDDKVLENSIPADSPGLDATKKPKKSLNGIDISPESEAIAERKSPPKKPLTRKDKNISDDIGSCSLVLWGDVPDPGDILDRVFSDKYGAKIEKRLKAGGLSFEETRNTAGILCNPPLSKIPVMIVAEAYDAPAEEIELFLQKIRSGGLKNRIVCVALADVLETDGWTRAREEDLEMWRKSLRRLPGTGAHLLSPLIIPEP